MTEEEFKEKQHQNLVNILEEVDRKFCKLHYEIREYLNSEHDNFDSVAFISFGLGKQNELLKNAIKEIMK